MDLRRAARTLHEHRSAPWLLGLRLAFLATAGMFLLYLLVANVILRTHLLRGWLGAHPQELFVEYRAAWSLYPGHVEVRDLAIRHQDKNIQLHLGLERAKLHLSLWALTQRTLLVDHLDVQGGTFRLTHKSVSPEGNEGRIRAFPSIEGFTEPFLPHASPGGAHPWTVEIDAITATMREVWTMEYRYRGDADVTGAFRVRPHHEIYVAPSVMVTHGGLLSLGDRELIRGGEGRVEATLDSFDPSVLHGIAIVRQLSGGVQQTGELASLASVADTYFPGANVHLDQLTYGVLDGGFVNPCYDGLSFFNAAHPLGKTGVVGTGSNIGTDALSAAALQAAITQMMRTQNDQGRPMGIIPDVLVVPPELYWEAAQLLNSAFYPDLLPGSGQLLAMNPLKGLLRLVTCPFLLNPSDWFLFDTKRPVKAILLQMRKEFEFEALEQNSETGFLRDEFFYGVRARYNAGYGDWRSAFGAHIV